MPSSFTNRKSDSLKTVLNSKANPEKAKASARFFKTGPGDYGEGDVFLGLTMPEQREITKDFYHLPLGEIEKLICSKEHEYRMCALIILVKQFQKGDEETRRKIHEFYLEHTRWVNNWDLVDTSAEHIVGTWLENRPEKMSVLKKLAQSENLWERRIAMLSTFAYIKKGNSREALEIAEILLHDTHDLIHKAVGWMLREVGKRCSMEREAGFLRKHHATMPRTMLRYAIEKFPEEKKRAYLKGTVQPPL